MGLARVGVQWQYGVCEGRRDGRNESMLYTREGEQW